MFIRVLFLSLFLIVAFLQVFAYDAFLPKGTLIKVYTRIPLNTQHLEEGSKVYFIVPADVWVQEEKMVEKGDIFQGYVSMLKMPVLGVNAAMKVIITDIIKTNGEKISVNGKLIFSSSDTLGGNLTNPATYNKTIHPRKVYGNIWGGTLQYVPSGEYEFGDHVGVTSRDTLFVELADDFYN